jgi:N-acetylmuramoyl-L-alanine amidase
MPSICIDPGHGGTDTGAVGNGLLESHTVLAIGLRVRELLRPHMDVVMTRDTDEFIPLKERCRIANDAGVDVYVSIHLNSASNTSASGHEFFTSGTPQSRELANAIGYRHAKAFPEQENRGIKLGDNLYVLKHTRMPAALTEQAFLSNNAECEFAAKESTQEGFAQAICDGVLDYFNMATTDQGLTLEQRVVRIENHLGI